MKTVKFEVETEDKASRLELFIRFIYLIILEIVLCFLVIGVMICYPLQWLCILLLGKRIGIFNSVIKAAFTYSAKGTAYVFLLTDERPEIMPEF